ncbi:molybdate ABC transporter substrate-binding protein [Candidatus Accumulibacter sp. ACC003]|uniref:molybdate ABC transporter substrate-binding protein n=1 Tax=Candidatus Accumulibacter sp. ACC003 TaxID=2823334 RepID=UPI0025B8633F|nr:molybdate ABC transporter substrate-binding protein [Candidatus Accumulibacter sp. ACC003]
MATMATIVLFFGNEIGRAGLLALLLAPLLATPSYADEVMVAVAANFAAPMQKIAVEFERATGHKAMLAFGSSGKLFAQIVNGAPFEVLLAADEAIPAQLERDGHALGGSRFTYATGRLALWSAQPNTVDSHGDVLRKNAFGHLALANPKTAPYGAAAIEVMKKLGVLGSLQAKLVQGENVAQTYQFAATGNADLAFVALSQIWQEGRISSGSAWIVPATLHQAVRQDAVLLEAGRDKAAAGALLAYLKGDTARAIIKSYGYAL